jgi:hypothetical protein
MRHPVTKSYADSVSWSLICLLLITCLAASRGMGFGILLDRAMVPGIGLAVLIGVLAVGRSRGNARLIAGATAFLQMTLFTMLGVVLTYLLASQAPPLWDAELAAADARLGLDWPAIFAAADRLPAAILLLGGTAYHSLVAQMVMCIVVLAGSGRFDRLRVTVAAAILAGVITVLVSGLVPAIGNLFAVAVGGVAGPRSDCAAPRRHDPADRSVPYDGDRQLPELSRHPTRHPRLGAAPDLVAAPSGGAVGRADDRGDAVVRWSLRGRCPGGAIARHSGARRCEKAVIRTPYRRKDAPARRLWYTSGTHRRPTSYR